MNPVEVVLRRHMGQERQLSLQVSDDKGFDKDPELLRLDKVGASGQLSDEHVEQEASLGHELWLGVSDTFLCRQWWDVQAWEAFHK